MVQSVTLPQPQRADGRTKQARERTARLALLAAVPNLAAVTTAAVLSNSLALLADLLLTLLDFASVLVVWWVAQLALKGLGVRLNYGYGKIESLTAGLVGFFMLVSLAVVLVLAIGRIEGGGVQPEGHGILIGLLVNLVSGAVNVWLLLRYRRQSREDNSLIIRSQILLFIDKVTSNVIMVLALAGWLVFADTAIGPYIDPLASLLIVGSMAYWAIQILRRALGELIDAACGEEVQMPVTVALGRYFEEYDGLGSLRTRRSGEDIFVEIELEFEPARSVAEVCALQQAMTETIRRSVPSARIEILPRMVGG